MTSDTGSGRAPTTPEVRFRVLGSLEVRRGDAPVALGGHRQRTLLAALLVRVGEVVSLDALSEAVWGEDAPTDPRNALQTQIARLREALAAPSVLVTRSPGYLLDVTTDQVDALRFERLLAEARRPGREPAVARELLDEALALWRGPAYAEFADGVARAEALRLEEQRLVAVEERAEARLALGEAGDMSGELRALLAEHPLRERLVGLAMRTLAAVDRSSDALAVYRRYRDRLADETGLEPSGALRDLELRILRGGSDPAGPAAAARASVARGPGATAMPRPPTSLVGRDGEVAEIRACVGTSRLTTLVGTGGVGKTRLAAEVAAAVDRDTGGEVAWIDLAAVADAASVDHVLATALGVDLAGAEPRQVVVDALAARSLLLVLDNCEHLLDTAADLAEAVQRGCPAVRILATSRERLAVDGERVVLVDPLPVDAVEGGEGDADAATPAAARLFLDRAATAGADLTDRMATVAELCRELDGLPLAIELAAARTGALPAETLLTMLREDAQVAQAAVGRRRGRSARHRDLRAVVDWSYRLLDADEQRLFERLAVFAGAVDADTVHDVCAPDGQARAVTYEQLGALAERSLVTGPLDPSGHYRMLRPLRAFARDRLRERGEEPSVARRHAAVMTERAERAAGPPMTAEGHRWLDASLDDLREAARHATRTGDLDLIARLVTAVYWYDQWRAGGELLRRAEEALALDGVGNHPAAAAIYAAATVAAWMAGDLDRARERAEQARRRAEGGGAVDDPASADRAGVLAAAAAADVALFDGRLDEAEAHFGEQARLAARAGDPDNESLGRAGTAMARAYAGDPDGAVTELDAATDAAARAGPAARAFVRYVEGECVARTAPDRAVALVEEAAGLAREVGGRFIENVARLTAASLRARHGDPSHALPGFADLLEHWRRSGGWTQQWTTLRNLVELLVRLEADEPAVVIAAAAASDTTAPPTFGEEAELLDGALATARSRLGGDRYDAAWSRGARLPRQEVVDLALRVVEDLADRTPGR